MKDIKGYLTIKEANKIITTCTKPRDKLLLILLANTGRRISEALSLKPKDIDFNEQMIYWLILKRKDIDHKWIATKKTLLYALKEYIRRYSIAPNTHVFKSDRRKDMPINRHRAYQIINYWGKKAGLAKIGERNLHPHTFRHSFCVWGARKVANAADLKLLQSLMGHAEIESTAYYLQFAQKEAKKLVNQLPDFMSLGLTDDELTEQLKTPEVLKFNSKGVKDKL